MEKYIESHQNNLLNPNATPFVDSWKSTLLAQARMLNIAIDSIKALDFRAISNIINAHLLQQKSTNQMTYPQDNSLQLLNYLSPTSELDLNDYYELFLLDLAGIYGIEIPRTPQGSPDFNALMYSVYLYKQLDKEGLELAEMARNYHMPIKKAHLENIMKLRFEIEDYELLLDSAMNAKIDWDTSTYDPEGLESAVAEANWNFEQQYWDYRMSVSIAYRVERGV